jgi:uncharacterized membrane protein YpjA
VRFRPSTQPGSIAWLVVVGVNLAGTAFGFWFYRFQYAATP